ncbi:MAG: type II toxin-antitoxin system HicB family antitoxin [Desulfobacteraceae bacterium]|nr:type II toxin-antitoxin system HicB family antitoxin [Desulfobacteraceae bacterium]
MKRGCFFTSYNKDNAVFLNSDPLQKNIRGCIRKGDDVNRQYGELFCTGKEEQAMQKEFYVVIEKDEDGFFVGEVPALKGCYAQGRNVDELMRNMRDVIGMCLEDETDPVIQNEFIGVQKVSIENEPANA